MDEQAERLFYTLALSPGEEIFLSAHYWFMFPISILIASVAMASGVEGATFFTPLFILVLGISPDIAIATGLITEVFGFASGLYAFSRKGLIDYVLGMSLLMVSVPIALSGTWFTTRVPPDLLKGTLALVLFAVAVSFLRAPKAGEVENLDASIKNEFGEERGTRCLVTKEGEKISYTPCNRFEGMAFAGLGGLFIGMISTGLGELNGYFLLQRCRVPSRVSVATTVFVVAITALCASAGHFVRIFRLGGEPFSTVLNIIVWTIPGVVIGGQLGAAIANKISQRTLELSLAFLFFCVALFTIGEIVL